MVYRQLGKCQLVKVKDVTKCFSFYYTTGIDSKNLTLGFDGRRHGLTPAVQMRKFAEPKALK